MGSSHFCGETKRRWILYICTHWEGDLALYLLQELILEIWEMRTLYCPQSSVGDLGVVIGQAKSKFGPRVMSTIVSAWS